MSVWIAIIFTGCLTFGTRFLPLSPLMPEKLPDWLQLAMKFVPVSVLSAIIIPAIFISEDTGYIVIQDNLRIAAAIVAIFVAYFSTVNSHYNLIWFISYLDFNFFRIAHKSLPSISNKPKLITIKPKKICKEIHFCSRITSIKIAKTGTIIVTSIRLACTSQFQNSKINDISYGSSKRYSNQKVLK